MSTAILRQSSGLDGSDSRTSSPKNEERFAARRAVAAANADVSLCENQALSRAASEALAARRRLDGPRS